MGCCDLDDVQDHRYAIRLNSFVLLWRSLRMRGEKGRDVVRVADAERERSGIHFRRLVGET